MLKAGSDHDDIFPLSEMFNMLSSINNNTYNQQIS